MLSTLSHILSSIAPTNDVLDLIERYQESAAVFYLPTFQSTSLVPAKNASRSHATRAVGVLTADILAVSSPVNFDEAWQKPIGSED